MRGAEAGVVIGGYELVRRIGRGGMAEVWVARRPLGNKGSKFVALKLIADHFMGDERYRRMFRAEAELAAVLSHANIVQVFDEGEHDGRSYLVMEWVDGLNLLKLGAVLSLLDDEDRRLRVTAYIIGQLLHALNYAHSITSFDGSPLGVVHRDVSPQNVLVSNHGEVKLTDFGVAFHNFEESSGIHVKGKVRYMAPEQIRGETRRATVDLYAVGALLHELLDGKRFRGEQLDGQELFTTVLSGQVAPLSCPAPPELERLRLALLEPDPNQRIQSAEHAIAMLKRYPAYGDARDELTKLCGSLTGVVKPRVGPGQSSKMNAAERRTVPWQWPQPQAPPKASSSAKPRPSPSPPTRPSRPPPPPPPTRPSRPPSPPLDGPLQARRAPGRTGSQTVVKGLPGRPRANALITGHTEFVSPRALGWPATQPAANSSTVAPAPPVEAAGLWPGNHHDTHPIAPVISTATRSGDTEVLDANLIVELASDSGTEQDILAPVVADDGTDTSRAARPIMQASSDSVSIVLSRRSAAVAVGFGLLMVAVLSVASTWLLFAHGRVDAAARTETAPSVVSKEVADEGEAGAEAEDVILIAANGAEHAPALAEEVQAEGGDVPGTAEGARAVMLAGTATEDDVLEAETAGDQPTATKSSRKSKGPVPKANVTIASSSGLERAQVRIRSRVLPVDIRHAQQITAGRKTIAWRRSQSEPWQSSRSWRFEPGQRVMIHISKNGPKIRAID